MSDANHTSAPEAQADTASEPATARTRRPITRRGGDKRKRSGHRSRFSLLVVRGDGVPIVRFNFPKRLASAALVAWLIAFSLVGALAADWWHVKQRLRSSATLFEQLDEQRATIDSFKRRVAELRQEMSSWRELNASIWEPFGPERGPRGRASGIGGSRATTPERPPAKGTPADELAALAESVMEQSENIRALEHLMTRASKALAFLPSRWPVRGSVNSEYGMRLSPWTKVSEFHPGLDIRAELGTRVFAPAAGVVMFAGSAADYGKTVMIDHGHEIRSLYGHLSKINVSQGQKIERGADLGLTGNTGRSSGPHLHYEIIVKGQSVNPRTYLWD